MLFPVLWFDMNMRISKSSAVLLKIIKNLEMYCHIFGAVLIILTLLLLLWQPLKRAWNKRYTHHMEINTINDDDANDNDDNSYKLNDVKEVVYCLPQDFSSLLYISHPRRSLPVIISHLDENEALSSCLEDCLRQDLEKELENMAHIKRNS